MSCVICGRGACAESFHSLDEQEDYEKHQQLKCDGPGQCRFCPDHCED